ncbi:mannitol-1-phosphate 5-dehydrogenase [Niallia sp. NCCP-28]|uniref:mannitol-1-phosphate 5-dehydrogenase n=1 Tax=Niallia sp. NCCP-28 TaxID=2934712 RepID=UPI0020872F66|nr:mannitol-1-phosphate 5-dehydrogenase [Niallia sp. NCCP-28]GKU84701.1 mannitol-1-phosphate 5-dehydrogenase [Niallia sp. NCCP-28]
MKAIHFGAGNIGRGFIGLLLHQSNYEVNFVDVNDQVIDAINNIGKYNVFLANDQKDTFAVSNIKGINSKVNPEKVIEAIISADLVTTAIGPNILKFIAPLIADGLKAKKEQNQKYLNIIACENMIGGSAQLKKFVFENLNEEEKAWAEEFIGFPNSAVDRIVPNQHNENLLDVLVEPFSEWVVDEMELKGVKPDIKGAHFVDNLQAYIERKLFTVNTGHAATAYLGNAQNYTTIAETISNKELEEKVLRVLEETGKVLVEKYNFNPEEHNQYIYKIIGRFSNSHIIDDVKRVGRSPLRKLGKNDRLVAPALEYLEVFKVIPNNLVDVMAAALSFYSEDDQESVQLQQLISEKGVLQAFSEVSGLEEHHELVKAVVSVYNK